MMLLIKNVKIIDGSGKPAYPSDVLVVGDKISAIGNFPHRQADQVIEGLGGYLTPGFIDIGTKSDHDLTLLTDPQQQNYLTKGITTIIGGHCGASLAPLLYGSLESIRKWADVDQININWNTVEEFFLAIKKIKLGINFGTLIGHSTIRRALVGEEQRELTEKEIKVFQAIIKESLSAGALGLSTGLSFVHARHTPYRELQQLTSILNHHNAVHAIHLRNEKENIYSSINEVVKLYRETGVSTLISHLRPLKNLGQDFDAAFDLLNKTTGLMNIHFDTDLSDTSIVPAYTLLPLWAQEGNLETMLELISQPASAKKIVKEIKFKKSELTIAKAIGHSFLENKEITDSKELLEIMRVTKLRTLIAHKNIDYPRLKKIAFSNKSLITASSDGFDSFLKIADQKIEKITGQIAQKFNIKNRGIIKEGNFADLVLLLNNQVHYVIINGQVAVYKGAPKPVTAGQVLLR